MRCLSPEDARRMNVSNAMVDAVLTPRGRFRPSRYMLVPLSICQAFDSLVRDTGVAWTDAYRAVALLTIVHESGHLRGGRHWQDEGRTQRWALRHFRYAALHIGLTPDRVRHLLHHAVAYHLTLPLDYRAPGCRRPWVNDVGLLRGCA